MVKTWKQLHRELLDQLLIVEPEKLSSEIFTFHKLWRETKQLIRSSMGISADEFEAVLRKAEKMMEPYDPDKTFYQSLITYKPENAAQRYYKEHPDTTKIIN